MLCSHIKPMIVNYHIALPNKNTKRFQGNKLTQRCEAMKLFTAQEPIVGCAQVEDAHAD